MPECSVIIPVFNQVALTEQCLRTILGRDDCEVVVVDDASTDGTSQLLASYGDRVKVVRHESNCGFATTCNDGARAASGKHLIFLNNDTIPQAGWLKALVDYAEAHPQAAVIGSKLLYPSHTIQHAGVVICQDGYPRHLYTGFPSDHSAVSQSRRFQIVTAASMLVRRPIFESNGGFDTAFRNGFEDVDLCLRLGEQGREVHYCAESVVIHFESVSPGRFRHDQPNVALYRQRWLNRVRPDDLQYYVADGLLSLSYEGSFPFHLSVSPLLAVVSGDSRAAESERWLAERGRQIADLTRENTRLRVELGHRAPESPELVYEQLRQRVRQEVQRSVPEDSTVLVVSKGDNSLLDLPGRTGWHFPRTPRGAYAGHHPASAAEAIEHLESLRQQGATHLLIPASSLWWLDHYADFHDHLRSRYARLEGSGPDCVIFQLADTSAPNQV